MGGNPRVDCLQHEDNFAFQLRNVVDRSKGVLLPCVFLTS